MKLLNDYYIKLFISIFLIIQIFIINQINISKNKIKNVELFNNNLFTIYNFFENDNYTIQSYFEKQKKYCNNFLLYYNELFENKIRLANFSLNGFSFPIFIYKKFDCVSDTISNYGYFEKNELLNIVEALKYYSHKNNINNDKDIYVLDIGGNIGVYPLYLGVFGYTILTFEASPINCYILYKNYCFNQKSNFIIINKGLSNKESSCSYYFHKTNNGNDKVLCDNIKDVEERTGFYKLCNVTLTQLNNFYPYLSDKHIALIKMDIEGSEGKALVLI